jgi:DtxR family transcriptional regulator, Mn-dependent transcriptional regulator
MVRPPKMTDTPTTREYLKAILRLEAEGSRVSTSHLAQTMGVSPGTVTEMVKRLAEAGLVSHQLYRGVELSPAGRELATAALRRHRVVERFLTDMLGFAWFEAHRLALGFEHQLADELEDRLFEATGRPSTCPHGYPIPPIAGSPKASGSSSPATSRTRVNGERPLPDLEPGEGGVVTHIAEEQAEDLLAFLDEMGLRPGSHVRLLETTPFDGPVIADVEGTTRTLGRRVAQQVVISRKQPRRARRGRAS